MLRYKLRTLLVILALGPSALAHFGRPIVHWLIDGPLITETLTYYDRGISYGSSWNLPTKRVTVRGKIASNRTPPCSDTASARC